MAIGGSGSSGLRGRNAGITDINPPIDENDVREQTGRVLSDPLFHNSRRYSNLLKFIVERTLDGEHECLKERIIGIEIFDRSPDYDTGADSIVRAAAGEVRKRLSRYYEGADHRHELRIELPTRTYVAEFKRPRQTLEQPCVDAHSNLEESESTRNLARPALDPEVQATPLVKHGLVIRARYAWIFLAAVAFLLTGWRVHSALSPSAAVDQFWAPILGGSKPVIISIGSPVSERTPGGAGLSVPTTGPGMTLARFISQQTNYPLADLSAANAITLFLAHRGKDSVIRLAQSTTLSDLNGGPVIVLGSFPNEWALRLGAGLPFQFQGDGPIHWIGTRNRPADRSWTEDLSSPYEQVTSEYALITRAYDQTTGQWWVGAGGLSVLGTLAAQTMLFDPSEMSAVSSQLPKDWRNKNLQVVIEIKMVKGSFGATHVVAARSW